MLDWFDAKSAVAFADVLAQLVVERTPQGGAGAGRVVKKNKAMLHQLEQHVMRFREQNRLNTFQKAKLGNQFKWSLREKGYDAAFVDDLTTWLMIKL